jgi:hypothetical protein
LRDVRRRGVGIPDLGDRGFDEGFDGELHSALY